MILNSSSIKKEAKEVLKGNWLKVTLVVFCYFLVKRLSSIIELLSIVLSIPLSFGLIIYFVKRKRGENVSVSDFFKDAFSDNFVRGWCVEGRILLKMIVPIILFVVSFVLCFPFLLRVLFACFVGSISVLATGDPSIDGLFYLSSDFKLFITGTILFSITLIYAYIRNLRYVYSFNIAYDNPELSAKECVKKSDILMKGNRFKLFKLSLSFIGWKFIYWASMSFIIFYSFADIFNININIFGSSLPFIVFLICSIVISIGSLFLNTYIRMSKTCFYENLKENIK